jgi:hypothetical protein
VRSPSKTFPGRVRGTADPSTALPRISCWTWWRCRTSCALLYGRAHTRPCLVQRGRKSGYASVGMTLLLGTLKRTSRCSVHPLHGPQAHDSSGRDDKGERRMNAGVQGFSRPFGTCTESLVLIGGVFNGAIWPPGCQIDDGPASLSLRQIRGGTVYWLM